MGHLATGDRILLVNGLPPKQPGSELPPWAKLTLHAQGADADWRLGAMLDGNIRTRDSGIRAGTDLCGVALINILGGGDAAAPEVDYSYPPSEAEAKGLGTAEPGGGQGDEQCEIDGSIGIAAPPTMHTLQGAFITLVDQLSTAVTMDLPTGALLRIEGQRTHVVLVPLSRTHFLAVAVPEVCLSAAVLQQRTARAVAVLRFLFGDIALACSAPSLRPRVDGFFDRFFLHATAASGEAPDFATTVAGCRTLRAPAALVQEAADILSSMFVHGGNSALNSPGTCLLVGSCLMYRSHVVHSQLSFADQAGVVGVCESFGLLESTRDVTATMHYWMPVYRQGCAGPDVLLVR